jgi:hypothetical protein
MLIWWWGRCVSYHEPFDTKDADRNHSIFRCAAAANQALVEMLGDRLLPIDAPLRTSCFKRMQTS